MAREVSGGLGPWGQAAQGVLSREAKPGATPQPPGAHPSLAAAPLQARWPTAASPRRGSAAWAAAGSDRKTDLTGKSRRIWWNGEKFFLPPIDKAEGGTFSVRKAMVGVPGRAARAGHGCWPTPEVQQPTVGPAQW